VRTYGYRLCAPTIFGPFSRGKHLRPSETGATWHALLVTERQMPKDFLPFGRDRRVARLMKGYRTYGGCHEQHHLACRSRGYRSVRTRLFRIEVGPSSQVGSVAGAVPSRVDQTRRRRGHDSPPGRRNVSASKVRASGNSGNDTDSGRRSRPWTLSDRICICCGAASTVGTELGEHDERIARLEAGVVRRPGA
jgi:hypothetical protein